MSQMASQAEPAATQSVSRTMNGFLTTVLGFGGAGRLASIANGAGWGNESAPYAQGSAFAPLAYAETAPKGVIARKASGAFNSVKPSPFFVPSWSVWTSAFGGGSRISGDVNTGSQNVNSNVYGLAVGADYRLTPDTTLGFALSGGETNFSLAGSSGSGNSNFFLGAAYARHWSGEAYLSATLAAGAHWVMATRSVAVGLAPDTLTASYTAPTIAGRIETGYRLAFGQFGLTPYGAAQAQQVWRPAHAETATSGTGATALTFSAHDVVLPRTELGAWVDHRLFGDIVLRGRLAWVHDYNRDASANETFQAAPGARILATGARRPADAGLVSAIAEVRIAPNVTFSTQFDGEFSHGAGSWAGTGRLRYVW
jgi:uncharacterized protein with beta-barrel porin domain